MNIEKRLTLIEDSMKWIASACLRSMAFGTYFGDDDLRDNLIQIISNIKQAREDVSDD